MQKERQVSLGCGTLILIAIIVMIFSNSSNDNVRNEVTELRNEVQQLHELVNERTAQLNERMKALQESLEAGAVDAPAAPSSQ